MRLILFDIDGTLLNCGPQVRDLFAGALEETFGTVGPLDRYSFAGKTDQRIVLDLMTEAGHDRGRVQELLPRMRSAYLERLEAGLQRRAMDLLPGVVDLLERLSRRENLAIGLLTGNWRDGARIKLSRFDLGPFFAFGAFGDDAVDRNDLVPVALERAERATGHRYEPVETLIIGDSLLDVACAHAHGAAVLAVATGHTSADDLAAAGANWVAADLPAAEKKLAWLAA